MKRRTCHIYRALTLLELLTTMAIVMVLAVVVLSRFGTSAADARKRGCEANRHHLEVQARLWHRTRGTWPEANLADIGANAAFLPAGLPACPVDGSPYTFDPSTQQIRGHAH